MKYSHATLVCGEWLAGSVYMAKVRSTHHSLSPAIINSLLASSFLIDALGSHAMPALCARVAESSCHFECSYLFTHRLPDNSFVETVDVVYGRVERIHVADHVLTTDGKLTDS